MKSFNTEITEATEMKPESTNQLTEQIIGAAIEVHREKGPGLLESAQLLSYIRETGHQVGLLINFHVLKLVDGVTRKLNDRHVSATSVDSVLKTAGFSA